jgi:hypothetical protein
LIVMIIALVLSFAAVVFDLSAHVSQGPFAFQGELVWVNLSVIGIGLLVAVLVFYGILRESINISVRVAVTLFVFSAIMSALIYLKLFLSTYGVSSPGLHLILTLTAYTGGFLGVMAIFDVLPRRIRNVLFAVCSGVLGAFIGALIPTIMMILILGIMAAVDLIATHRSAVKNVKKIVEDYEMLVLLKLSYAGKTWAVGIGDLISYSILVANALMHIGWATALISLVLILVGSFVATARARKLAQTSGLPLAVGLGLVPVVAFTIFPVPV